MLWGANPLSTGIHVWKYVNEARAAGAHVVCIDPLRSPTAERCDEHIAPHPGTDAALALGLMRVIRDAGAADEAWLAAHAVGWPELRDRLDDWPVERAAAIMRPAGGDRPRRSASGSRRRGRPRSWSASACSGTPAPPRRCARSSRSRR